MLPAIPDAPGQHCPYRGVNALAETAHISPLVMQLTAQPSFDGRALVRQLVEAEGLRLQVLLDLGGPVGGVSGPLPTSAGSPGSSGTVGPAASSPGSPGGIVATPRSPGVVLVDVVAGCSTITLGAVFAVVVGVAGGVGVVVGIASWAGRVGAVAVVVTRAVVVVADVVGDTLVGLVVVVVSELVGFGARSPACAVGSAAVAATTPATSSINKQVANRRRWAVRICRRASRFAHVPPAHPDHRRVETHTEIGL